MRSRRRATACWTTIAAVTAPAALLKTRQPSPMVLINTPSPAPTAVENALNRARLASSARSTPSRPNSSVEPTTSATSTVKVRPLPHLDPRLRTMLVTGQMGPPDSARGAARSSRPTTDASLAAEHDRGLRLAACEPGAQVRLASAMPPTTVAEHRGPERWPWSTHPTLRPRGATRYDPRHEAEGHADDEPRHRDASPARRPWRALAGG